MRTALCSIGFNRPELLRISLDYIVACDGIKKIDWFCFIDGNDRSTAFLDSYPFKELKVRGRHIGLTKNILFAIQDCFDKESYDRAIIIEDDVIVSRDFLRFMEYCFDHLKDDEVFTVSGYSTRKFIESQNYSYDEIVLLDWYHPWGVGFDRADYELIRPHITDEYFSSPSHYFNTIINPIAQKRCPDYYKECLRNLSDINPFQAGLINTIRAINRKCQIMPCRSRCQNIGFYGHNQNQKKYNGEDLNSENVRRKAMHYTDSFKDDYIWKRLRYA